MSSRSLNVAPQNIQKVKNALKRNGFRSQTAFATEMGVHRNTIIEFVNGRNIDRNNFIDCCEKLGLDWQEIVDKPVEIDEDPNFVGREKAIADLHNLTQQHKLILIHADGGVGKTELGKKYLKNQDFDKVIELLMAKETQNVSSVEGVVEEWIKQEFGQEPARDFMINLGRLRKLLESQKIGILIDNLEPALENGKFIKQHRDYVELLRVLGKHDGKSITLITSREELAESAIKIKTYPLEGLTEEAWQDYFSYHNIDIDQPTLKAMRDAYGGNAKAMTIIAGAITEPEDNDGDMEKYWKINKKDLLVKGDLKDLVNTQFERLKKHDPDAYNLLCRLGCYRYQDVPTVPTEGLFCLLWDVEDNKQRVIERLKSRALIEYKNGEYWLHPVIKQEAVERLKNTEDWEKSNRQAAEFWTESVKEVHTVDDALRAFEAYYHNKDIKDFEKCAEVIIYYRRNSFSNRRGERLGRSFYRFSLFKTVESSIIDIENQIQSVIFKIILYDILGNIRRFTGNTNNAIKLQDKVIKLAEDCIKSNSDVEFSHAQKMELKIYHLWAVIHRGLCYLDKQEVDNARSDFVEAIKFINNQENLISYMQTKYGHAYHHFCVMQCKILLALIDSFNDQNKLEVKNMLGEIMQVFNEQFEYMTDWSKGYTLVVLGMIYKNIHEYSESSRKYEEAIKYTEERNHKQVRAKAFIRIGELYRIQKDYDQAIENHEESIKILEELGAKCDLAEAYYQIALTYQEKSQVYFDKAIELFTKIDAPKQIERVRKSIQTP